VKQRHEQLARRTVRGFTLVEALATIVVIGVLGSVTSSVMYAGVSSYRDAALRLQVHQEVSTAMEFVASELRRIPVTAGPAPAVTLVTPNSIAWGTSSLSVAGGNLHWVDSGEPVTTLLTDVTAFDVQCFDESNIALATTLAGTATAPIRRVQVAITVTRQGIAETLRMRVFLRNLMSGAVP
jgi:prepilin-type N-terminal cleavage/methylation domain-containing protein